MEDLHSSERYASLVEVLVSENEKVWLYFTRVDSEDT